MSDVQSRTAARRERELASRWFWALCISLSFHILAFGTYESGRRLGWWQRFNLASILPAGKMLTEVLAKKEPPPTQKENEEPLIFINVDPATATAEPPKNATHYSSKNAVAANELPANESTLPKITGEQTHVPETKTIPKTEEFPLKPSPPKNVVPSPQTEEEQKPKKTEIPGDLAMAKPEPEPRKDEGDAEKARPRRLAEALARHPELKLPSRKMSQEGGVLRGSIVPSFDTKMTPYGDYDAALIEAVKSRWYQLLDERDYSSEKSGKVVLQFTLHYDGRVSDLSVQENTVGEVLCLLCQKAVLDPSPYPKWPVDMRRMLRDLRTVSFTFYYN